LINSDRKHELTATQYLLYLAAYGKDWRRAFTLVTNRRQLDNQIELVQVSDRLAAIGLRCAAFYEPDDDFGLTAICTDPINDSCRRFFRDHPLWSDAETERGPP
jgi:hypothetical protein